MIVTKVLIPDEPRVGGSPPVVVGSPTPPAAGAFAQSHARRVRRLKLNAGAWVVGATLLTTLWVRHQWNANGAFESIGFSGREGEWNPTLWALGVGLWAFVVGIMALGVHFDRPSGAGRRAAQVRFHVAAWVFGMLVLTPLSLLIEWQDNGAFERWSRDSQPGSWDPWILVVAGIWALSAAALLAVRLYRDRRSASG